MSFKHQYVQEYVKRYGLIFNVIPDHKGNKKAKKDIFKELVFMENEKLYRKLHNEYHPFFAEMIYSTEIPPEELADLIGTTRSTMVKKMKDPIGNLTIYECMRLADLLYVSTDLILMNILQRDFNETVLKQVSFRKIVEERIWKDARERKEKLNGIKDGYKEILKDMLSKMV